MQQKAAELYGTHRSAVKRSGMQRQATECSNRQRTALVLECRSMLQRMRMGARCDKMNA
jgi:hypothetical protein